jgi:hypothetical protein
MSCRPVLPCQFCLDTELLARSSLRTMLAHAAAAGASLRALLALRSLRQVLADASATRLGEVARLTPPLTLLLALVETVGHVLVRVDNPVIVARCLCSEASRGFRRTAMLPAQLLERFSAQSTRAYNYLASLYQSDARAALAVCCCSCCFGPARRGRSVGLPRELELQNLLRA